jgi:hypothetical protein
MRDMAELTHAEKAILRYLRKDAAKCGKIYHFDPGWVARKAQLREPEFHAAARRLRSMSLISIHEFEWNGHTHLTDIALIDNSIPPAYSHNVIVPAQPGANRLRSPRDGE